MEIEINPEYTMLKKVNKNLYLSQEQMDILKEYQISYEDKQSLSDLFLEIEEIYNQCGDDVLNNLLDVLSERDYYENYNK